MRLIKTLAVALLVSPATLLALDIEGVQMAAMDQPRVTVSLRRDLNAAPLAGKSDLAMAQLLGLDKQAAESSIGFAAFLDTGASGICLSTQTADSLGIKRLAASGGPQQPRIIFHDIGVGGSDQFNVSEPLYLATAAYQALGVTGDASSFQPAGGPWHVQVGPLGGGSILSSLIGGLDVAGMPVMAGKIVVLDARGVNSFSDTIHVQLVDPTSRQIRLPDTQRHVLLSYGDFRPYTRIEPAGSHRPVITANPFIGSAPVPPGKGDRKANVVARHQSLQTQGAWLLDTGAAASMISTRQAEALGVRYKPGTKGTGAPELIGVPKTKQFTLTVGGIGGQTKSAGFFLDELHIPTAEGEDLVFKPAPVLVCDIAVEQQQTHEKITLDGVFGMNFLVASAAISEGIVPDIGQMVEGAFDFIVIDHIQGRMGLALRSKLAAQKR